MTDNREEIVNTFLDNILLCDWNCPEHNPAKAIREKLSKLLSQSYRQGVEEGKSKVSEALGELVQLIHKYPMENEVDLIDLVIKKYGGKNEN